MLICCDASQLEWRVASELSQDPVAIKEILEGQDTHSLNQKYFNFQPGPEGRLIAKIYLFRTIFRGSGWAFANDPDFMHVSSSPKYWDNVNRMFYEKYVGLDRKHKEWAQEVVNNRPIEGPLGRFWPIEMTTDWKGEIKIPWTILTNYPVQGTGADIMTIARISFMKRLKKLKLEKVVLLISSVHDSIVVDAPREFLQDTTNLFHQVFDDLQKNIKAVFGYDWHVPLSCEVKAGHNMKNMTKCLRTDV